MDYSRETRRKLEIESNIPNGPNIFDIPEPVLMELLSFIAKKFRIVLNLVCKKFLDYMTKLHNSQQTFEFTFDFRAMRRHKFATNFLERDGSFVYNLYSLAVLLVECMKSDHLDLFKYLIGNAHWGIKKLKNVRIPFHMNWNETLDKILVDCWYYAATEANKLQFLKDTFLDYCNIERGLHFFSFLLKGEALKIALSTTSLILTRHDVINAVSYGNYEAADAFLELYKDLPVCLEDSDCLCSNSYLKRCWMGHYVNMHDHRDCMKLLIHHELQSLDDCFLDDCARDACKSGHLLCLSLLREEFNFDFNPDCYEYAVSSNNVDIMYYLQQSDCRFPIELITEPDDYTNFIGDLFFADNTGLLEFVIEQIEELGNKDEAYATLYRGAGKAAAIRCFKYLAKKHYNRDYIGESYKHAKEYQRFNTEGSDRFKFIKYIESEYGIM